MDSIDTTNSTGTVEKMPRGGQTRARDAFVAPGAALALLLLALHQLLVRPVVGLADNNDFRRVLRPLHLATDGPPAVPFHVYVELHWKHVRHALPAADYHSSAVPLLRAVVRTTTR